MLPYLTKLIKKLAPKVGAKVVVEPEWGIAAQIIYSNGVVRSLRMYSLDLNHIASSDIARDKDYAKFFMAKRGFPVAEGQTVFEDNWAKTVKSNRTISYGIKNAIQEVFKVDKIAIIERYLPGRDYRIVVLDGEIISAYERMAKTFSIFY